jgi:hypothetical protein
MRLTILTQASMSSPAGHDIAIEVAALNLTPERKPFGQQLCG